MPVSPPSPARAPLHASGAQGSPLEKWDWLSFSSCSKWQAVRGEPTPRDSRPSLICVDAHSSSERSVRVGAGGPRGPMRLCLLRLQGTDAASPAHGPHTPSGMVQSLGPPSAWEHVAVARCPAHVRWQTAHNVKSNFPKAPAYPAAGRSLTEETYAGQTPHLLWL